MKHFKRLMLVDMLNLFYRNYIANPSLSNQGLPIGGLAGSLKSLQKMTREINPDEIVLCWDGEGGSKKRKGINSSYKEGRKPIKLNRSINHLSEDEELRNKIWQQTRLIEYLNLLPIIQFKFEGVEADDVIAYLTQISYYEDFQKIIVSSDKDFFQLCNDLVIVYRPVNRRDKEGNLLPTELVTKKTLIRDHNIHPNNFALARSLAGDSSDNLPGVGGVGLKTAAKRFSELKSNEKYSIDDLLKLSKSKCLDKKPIKAYENVIKNEDILRENYKLMQLYVPSLGLQHKDHVDDVLNNFDYFFNKTTITEMLITDGLASLNLNNLFSCFNRIINNNK